MPFKFDSYKLLLSLHFPKLSTPLITIFFSFLLISSSIYSFSIFVFFIPVTFLSRLIFHNINVLYSIFYLELLILIDIFMFHFFFFIRLSIKYYLINLSVISIFHKFNRDDKNKYYFIIIKFKTK
jgi:hypothetical protein